MDEAAITPTVDEIKAQMRALGVTISGWADEHGFSRETTYAVLSGRIKGVRGEAYQVACALGLVSRPNERECRWLRYGGVAKRGVAGSKTSGG